MFCTKCGSQNPDGVAFCTECGAPLSASAPAVPQPVRQETPLQQPMSQPMPVGEQSVKKSKTVPIIIGVCSALVAAFLIVLFTVIIPNSSSVKGKIKNMWRREDGSYAETYDFVAGERKYGYGDFEFTMPFEWKVEDDILSITTIPFADMPDFTSTVSYKVSFSSDDKVMTLNNVDDPADSLKLTRVD